MPLITPVVFLVYDRPELTQLVFDTIRKAQPRQLLVVADGPQNANDEKKCADTRAVIETVDWECEVIKNYSPHNLGCRKRIVSGLDWAFSHVEEAIILEDDCLPCPSFFEYCQNLLAYYSNEPKVATISGVNFQDGKTRGLASYYFSKYTHVWGWATWRRTWEKYDPNITAWPDFKNSKAFGQICDDRHERRFWQPRFDSVHSGTKDTWDYQLVHACWLHGGLNIAPNRNMVKNIGFGNEATHTSNESSMGDMDTEDIRDIEHPESIICDKKADHYTFRRHYRKKPKISITSLWHKTD